MPRFFVHSTTAGPFVIASDSEGRWALGFETEALGPLPLAIGWEPGGTRHPL